MIPGCKHHNRRVARGSRFRVRLSGQSASHAPWSWLVTQPSVISRNDGTRAVPIQPMRTTVTTIFNMGPGLFDQSSWFKWAGLVFLHDPNAENGIAFRFDPPGACDRALTMPRRSTELE